MYEAAGTRSHTRHLRYDEMRATARPLPAFEIAIGRRRATFARLEAVVVHRKTHRAARLAPFEAGVAKYAIQSFRFGLRLDGTGPRDDECQLDVVGNMPAADDRGGL